MVHFVDTSVLVNLLKVPFMCDQYDELKQEYDRCFANKDIFVLPMAAIVETGNHIAQIQDGNKRWEVMERFISLVKNACQQNNNMSVMPNLSYEEIQNALLSFQNNIHNKIGYGDATIVEQFNTYWRDKQPIGEMRIWSIDRHLQNYHQTGGLTRRKTL